jgi:hypothetical protein
MLYQLSYASPAQTEQKYHRGNRIASNYLSPSKTIASKALICASVLVRKLVRSSWL